MNVIVGNAWPYANGSLHLGRIAVLLPGDIIARYHRLMGDEVIFISGTDCHGTPVTMKAKEEGLTPLETVEKYHKEFIKCFNSLGFSFDIFEKTHNEFHEKKVKEFILDLYNKGYIYEKNIDQDYCEVCDELLQDRAIEGRCPHCGGYATGIECEDCNKIIETIELIDRKCKVCGNKPIVQNSTHLFFSLSKFEKDVKRLVIRQKGWRNNALNIVNRYLNEGLRDRAVTRDFHWGVDVPLSGYEDKKIFVWIEAVMGYLTASMKCLETKKEDYKEYWDGEDSRVYFVHGKDNIPFHTVIFPAILAGLDIKNPNIREISSEYLKLEGKNFSAVKNWALWVDYITEKYNVDLVRYYLTVNSPEEKDSDFNWREFININNNDLVGCLGTYILKVNSFVMKNYNGRIPQGQIDQKIQSEILNTYFNIGDMIEEGNLRSSLKDIMALVKRADNYFDSEKPWVLLNTNKQKCNEVVFNSIQIIANIANLIYPFMPFTAEKIKESMELDDFVWSFMQKKQGQIKPIKILFKKLDKKVAIYESKRLKEMKN